MGGCFSASPTAGKQASTTTTTAKVITSTGALWEFSSPIKASLLTDESSSSPFFVCNSDLLFHGERIPALKPDELLLPGHLYFILPARKPEARLTGGEMADLAGKAMAALVSSNDSRKKKGQRVVPGGVAPSPVVVQKSRSTRAVRVAPVTSRMNLGTIHEED